MLLDEEKNRIREEDIFREEVRREIERTRSEESRGERTSTARAGWVPAKPSAVNFLLHFQNRMLKKE